MNEYEYEIIIPGSGTFVVESDKELTDQEAYRYAKQQADQMTAGEKLSRGAAIATRAAAPTLAGAYAGGALAGAPGALAGSMAIPAGDLLNTALNLGLKQLGVDYQLPMASQSIQNLMTMAGMPGAPETQTPSERVGGAAIEALASTGRSLPALQALQTGAQTVAGRELAKTMAAEPITQITAAPLATGVGQAVTEKTDNPLLGMLAAITTGGVAGLKTPKKEAAPTSEMLKEYAAGGYKTAYDQGVLISQKALKKAGQDIVNKISNQIVIDPQVDTEAVAVINRLQKSFNRPQTLEELDLTRQFIQSSAKGDNRSATFAKKALKEFDDYIDTLGAKDIVSGDPQKAVGSLKAARDAWKRKSKTEVIEDLMSDAELRSNNYSQSGLENAIRRKLVNLATSDEMRFFSKSEQAAIKAAAKGGPVQNVMRWLGKFSPSAVVSMGLGSYWGAQTLGPQGALIAPAVGLVSKKGAEVLSMRQIKELRDMMALGRRPQAIGGVTRAVPATAIRGLLGIPDSEEQQYQWRVAN